MSAGDIVPFENAGAGKMGGSLKYYVASGATGADSVANSHIKAGEPVQKAAGVAGVIALVTNGPTASCRIVGVATSTSNETASASGTVDVIPAVPGQLWLIKPNVAATWNTQAKYNALIGSRVLIDNTSGVYTILAADTAGAGCIVEYLDVAKYPGLVAFSFSKLVDYGII
jgi:hypothetical protein